MDRTERPGDGGKGEGPGPGWNVPAVLVTALIPLAGWPIALALARRGGPDRGRGVPEAIGAPRGPRIIAGGIDLCLAFGLLLIPYVGWALAWGFLLFRDSFLGGRGPGKRIMGLAVVVESGGSYRLLTGACRDALLRNATMATPLLQVPMIPLEMILILTGATRIGERFAPRTKVVVWEADMTPMDPIRSDRPSRTI
ncbi:MAG: RDD family protein [Planctomycetota bacterium]